jgi:hypothetical protein
MALDVLCEMPGQEAALDVGRPAGGEVDDEREPLAFVEWLVGGGGRRGSERRA